MVGDHQPGQADFRWILPDDVDWKPFPSVLIGEPTQVGPYVVTVKVASGVKLMPTKIITVAR